ISVSVKNVSHNSKVVAHGALGVPLQSPRVVKKRRVAMSGYRSSAVFRALACLPCMLIGWLITSSRAADEGPASPATISKAWANREHSVGSLYIKWVEKQTFERGAILNPTEPLLKNPKSLTVPESPKTFEVTHELTLKGNKMR